MYLSLLVKFLGDKFTLYLSKIIIANFIVCLSLFILPCIIEKRLAAVAPSEPQEESKFRVRIKGLIAKVWAKIPKYSDL